MIIYNYNIYMMILSTSPLFEIVCCNNQLQIIVRVFFNILHEKKLRERKTQNNDNINMFLYECCNFIISLL